MSRFVPGMGLILVLASLVGACASTSGSSHYDKNYDFASVERVAVVAMDGAPALNREAAQNQIASMFNQQLLDKGYSPVERSRINSLIEQQKFARSRLMPASGAAQLGRILSVDATIILTIPHYGQMMEMSAKMVDVDSARVIWSANDSAKAAGAGVNQKSGTSPGGEAGASGGAGAGQAMTPRREEQAAKLIRKLTESLPSGSGSAG